MTLRCDTCVESWALREPFEIAREVKQALPLLVVTLTDAVGREGRGEAAGVDYDGETPLTMAAQIRAVASRLDDNLTGTALQALLPAGGARNALDCALWDLRARQSGVPAWRSAGLQELQPCATALTIGLGTLAETRRRARAARSHALVKLKVDATRHVDRLRAVRDEHPQARLIVDANQAWSRELLEDLMPALQGEQVELIEQPLPRGQDAPLDGLASPIPLCADESCTDRTSLPSLAGRYQAINIKLDKCGGLTEALALAEAARARGFGLMVGNMCGTSLGMAPALLIAQRCHWVDLDGPLLQDHDRSPALHYAAGRVHPGPPGLWG